MDNPVIIVGCGGTGITTITSLNRMLASNPETRNNLHNEVFYLVADTEQAALKDFDEQIKRQMMGAESPYSEQILLSENVTALRQVVGKYFEGIDELGLSRIKENWWFDNDGKPFDAHLVADLLLGAGQCPPASYCLAWKCLRKIEQAVARIIDQIIVHGNGNPNILSKIQLYIVAGLAGGTGRGTWNLIAFKIRQYLEKKYGKVAAPVGIFFDAEVFENVKKSAADGGLALKVNSITGLSELSCWLKASLKGRDKDTFLYRLPDMVSPARESSDVLATTLGVCSRASAPVASSILICGRSPSAVLANNRQYHEMAGAGLYSIIASGDVNASIVNGPLSYPYNSMAAASCEVDTLHLQSYFESIACGVALERLAKNSDDVTERVDEFFRKVPIDISVRSAADLQPNRGGKLMQRAAYALLARCAGGLNSLREELPTYRGRNAGADAQDFVTGLLDGMKAEDISVAVKSALAKKNAPDETIDVLKEVERAMRSVYKGDAGKGEKPSLGRAKRFLAAVQTRLAATEKFCVPAIQLEGEDGDRGDARTVTLAKVQSRAGRNVAEILRGVPPFNPQEVNELVKCDNGIYNGIVPTGVIAVNYPKLLEAFKAELRPARQRIAELVNAFELFENLCDETKELLSQEAPIAAGGNAGDDAFGLLFVRPDEVESALPGANDRERYYRRVLKPVYEDRAEVEALIANSVTVDDGVEKFLSKAISAGTDGKSGALLALTGEGGVDSDLLQEFQDNLISTIKANVRLPDDFMVSNFSFMKVLERNRKAWNARLQALSGSTTKYASFCQKLQLFTGADPVRHPNAKFMELPPVETLLEKMAISLASTTTPYWLIEHDADVRHEVKVFLPVAEAAVKSSSSMEAHIKGAIDYANVEPYFQSKKNAGASPFMLCTFAIESLMQEENEIGAGRRLLDKVHSFIYRTEPLVEKMLLKAESRDGDSIFDYTNGNKGIGFVSPIYVRNEKLRELRWKPWVKSDDSAERDAAADAILYAYLGNGLSEKDKARIAEILEEGGYGDWTMPLIKQGAKQTFAVTRKTCSLDEDGTFGSNPDCIWKPGKKLCVSACNLYPFIQGKGKVGRSGHATDKDIEEGNLVRNCLLKELQVFEEEIRPSLGDLYKKLVKGRLQFLTEMRDKADDEDRPTWEVLLARAKKLK